MDAERQKRSRDVQKSGRGGQSRSKARIKKTKQNKSARTTPVSSEDGGTSVAKSTRSKSQSKSGKHDGTLPHTQPLNDAVCSVKPKDCEVRQTIALSRQKVPKQLSLVMLSINGQSTNFLLDVVDIDAIVQQSVRTTATAARLWVQSKYILDIMIYMKPKRANRNIYVMEITTKKASSTLYPGSRAGYKLRSIRYRGINTSIRGKYKVHRQRRRKDGRKRRRVLAVTALINIGHGNKSRQQGGITGAGNTRLSTPESARGYLGGTVLYDPGAPAARPAGPGLPAGGDAADYD